MRQKNSQPEAIPVHVVKKKLNIKKIEELANKIKRALDKEQIGYDRFRSA